jgi:hypothetical protein
MIKCKSGGLKAIYFIDSNDVKSYSPFEMKRKYGKFDRVIKRVDMDNDTREDDD